MTSIKFKLLDKDATEPTKSTTGACGFDISATSINKVYNETGMLRYIEYGTGIAVEVPKGYCMLAMPRSSVSNTSLMLTNSVGLIDNDFRGEIKFRFKCDYSTITEYGLGDRIGQLLILSMPDIEMVEVLELSQTDRGDKGYGSTGMGELG